MLKRLWLIFGPIFIAGFLVLLLIFFYPSTTSHNLTEEKYSAASISRESFKERSQKVRALTDPNMRFVPFLGSSEWIRFDSVHPAVLAEKYNRPTALIFQVRQERPRLTNISVCNRFCQKLRKSRRCLSSLLSGLQRRTMSQHSSKTTLTTIS